jgi:VWFA-related protein
VNSGYSLKVDVNWSYLNVAVRDPYTNRSVPDLGVDDFVVYEDGQLQRIEKFDSIEAPFSLLLLLDVSGSTKDSMDLIKDASVAFTQEINPSDQIAVATFNSRTRLVQDFTNDRRAIERSIRQIRSGGGTAFYDALETSINDYMAGMEGRKAIVVFSDGEDNQLTGDYNDGSTTTFPELYRDIQEVDTIIYTIFLSNGNGPAVPVRGRPGQRGGGSVIDILEDIMRGGTMPGGSRNGPDTGAIARDQMQQIANQTGGRMYAPRDIYDLRNSYSEIADDLRVLYTLAYNSTNPVNDGRWREIRVQMRYQKNLAVRTRKGYYSRSLENRLPTNP